MILILFLIDIFSQSYKCALYHNNHNTKVNYWKIIQLLIMILYYGYFMIKLYSTKMFRNIPKIFSKLK